MAWLPTIAAVVGVSLLGIFACSPGAMSKSKVKEILSKETFENIEYKIRLSLLPTDRKQREELLKRLTTAHQGEGQKGQIDQKRCQRIEFLDDQNKQIRAASYILRRRVLLEDKECFGKERSKGDLTWKFRSKNTETIQTAPEWKAEKTKREEDVLIGLAPDGDLFQQSVWSVSLKQKGLTNPSSLGEARQVFPGILAEIPDELSITASCRIAFERRWKLDLGNSGPGSEWDLATWYLADSGRPADEPFIAELSFKASATDRKEAEKRLVHILGSLKNWVGTPTSKTGVIYQCNHKG